jgi:hypothetical protein
MPKRLGFALCVFFLIFPSPWRAEAQEFDPNFVLADPDIVQKSGWGAEDIQRFLEEKRGALAQATFLDLDGITRKASGIIDRVARTVGVNAKFLLTMLQKEQSLVTDSTPSQKQYDWAMGYAVCDSCSMNDGSIARFKGFAKQVDSAARQFTEGYFADLRRRGSTITGLRPGVGAKIDGRTVVPQTQATAAMYTYTPHLEGNENAWRIWQDWFGASRYPSGTVLEDQTTGDLYLIRQGKRRRVASRAILASWGFPQAPQKVPWSVIAAVDEGEALRFPNYALVRDERGDIFLLLGDEKRRFESLEDVARLGLGNDEVFDATVAELGLYRQGDVIRWTSEHPEGLLQKTADGQVFYVVEGVRHFVASPALQTARFPSWKVQKASANLLTTTREGRPVLYPDGTLFRLEADATVYVVSDGKRSPIANKETFEALGYKGGDVRVVGRTEAEIHQPGALIRW